MSEPTNYSELAAQCYSKWQSFGSANSEEQQMWYTLFLSAYAMGYAVDHDGYTGSPVVGASSLIIAPANPTAGQVPHTLCVADSFWGRWIESAEAQIPNYSGDDLAKLQHGINMLYHFCKATGGGYTTPAWPNWPVYGFSIDDA